MAETRPENFRKILLRKQGDNILAARLLEITGWQTQDLVCLSVTDCRENIEAVQYLTHHCHQLQALRLLATDPLVPYKEIQQLKQLRFLEVQFDSFYREHRDDFLLYLAQLSKLQVCFSFNWRCLWSIQPPVGFKDTVLLRYERGSRSSHPGDLLHHFTPSPPSQRQAHRLVPGDTPREQKTEENVQFEISQVLDQHCLCRLTHCDTTIVCELNCWWTIKPWITSWYWLRP